MRAWDLFLSDVNGETLSHAYMIYGVDSIATSRFLKNAAAAIVCTGDNKPCGRCLDCKKAENGTHPDVYKIPDEGKKILVDDIMSLVDSAYVRPIESSRKVYLIEGMEQANEKAQNKLLKILEEPVKNTVFLLSAASLQYVLPTVQSRVKKLAAEENTSFFLEAGAAEHTAVRKCIVEMYQNMRASSDILDFVNIFSRFKDTAGFLGFLELITRDMILCNAGKDDLMLNKDQKDDIMRAAEDFSTTALANILGHIANRRKDLGVNTNMTPVLDKLLYSILEEKHKCPK